jgi:hypothetical protein
VPYGLGMMFRGCSVPVGDVVSLLPRITLHFHSLAEVPQGSFRRPVGARGQVHGYHGSHAARPAAHPWMAYLSVPRSALLPGANRGLSHICSPSNESFIPVVTMGDADYVVSCGFRANGFKFGMPRFAHKTGSIEASPTSAPPQTNRLFPSSRWALQSMWFHVVLVQMVSSQASHFDPRAYCGARVYVGSRR